MAEEGSTGQKVRRVVVADDDADIVDILTFNLEAAGYSVLSANDGEAARDLILSTLPDLVVLDVMMPKMDGLEVLTEAGYQPEVAYFECLHELKLIVDFTRSSMIFGPEV